MDKFFREKNRRAVIFLCFLVSVFMLVDSYFVPKKTKGEIVKQMRQKEHVGINKRFSTYTIETNKKERNFNRDVYYNVSVGDSVYINFSTVTGTLQSLSIYSHSKKETFNIGFINTSIGLTSISVAFFLMLIYLLLHMANYNFEKNSTTIGILLMVIFVITQHFRY
jgi:hypothetical protein